MPKCKVCKNPFTKQRENQIVCTPECAYRYTVIQNEKRQKEQEKKAKKARNELKRQLKTRAEWNKEAQSVFNAFIRERDKGKPCISCGVPLGGVPNSYDAGHYRSRGAASHLRFDEKNVHGQCKKCNRYLSGNVVEYRNGLKTRIGMDELERLENDNEPRVYSKEDLIEIKSKYGKKLRDLRLGKG